MDRAELTVEATPDTVWNLVSDITRAGEWSPEATGGRWRGDATGPAVGARFLGGNRHGAMRWSTHCRVTEAEPPTGDTGAEPPTGGTGAQAPGRFTFVVTESQTAWGWILTPSGGGATHVVAWRESVGTPPLPIRLVQRSGILGRNREALMRDGLQRSLERVKEIVER